MGRKPTGTGSSYVPRELLHPIEGFGQVVGELEPAAGLLPIDRRVRGAQLQHLVMVQLRSDLKRSGTTVQVFARSQGMSVDRLYRVMRGEALMQIADLAAFALIHPGARAAAVAYLKQLPDPDAELKASPRSRSRDLSGREIFESRNDPPRGHRINERIR